MDSGEPTTAAQFRTVLLVDDDGAHRYATGRRLVRAGFNVLEAATGEEALAQVHRADAVILDVRLPDLSGYEVCRRIRERPGLNSVPVLQISGDFVADEDLARGLRGGADAYLTRPVDEDVIVANLEALLRMRRNFSDLSEELDIKRRNEQRASDLFLAVLSHDLRNPLDAIAMTGQLLARAPASAELMSNAAARIVAASERMKHMLDDIQDYARSALGAGLSLRCAPGDLQALVSSVSDEFRASHPDVALSTAVSGETAAVWDQERLARVLSNLLRNAVEHGAAGRPIELQGESDGSTVRLRVRNEGEPIAPEVVARLFEPMVKKTDAAAARGNMGLGLYVCHQVVRAHGGTITVASEGQVTEFLVTLPAQPTPDSLCS